MNLLFESTFVTVIFQSVFAGVIPIISVKTSVFFAFAVDTAIQPGTAYTFSNDDSKQINQLTQDMIKNTTIPLPPFAEQKRIVTAIETAFAQLDEIANSIS